MNNNSNENNTPERLDELIGKLFSPSQAQNIKADIAAGDKIMELLTDVPVSDELLNGIKTSVRQKVEKQNSRTGFKKIAALTAAAIVLIAIVMFSNEAQLADRNILITVKTDGITEIYEDAGTSLWDNFETTQGAELILLEMEIEDIAGEITAAVIDSENNGTAILSTDVDNLELEIIETDTMFWKG